jgi:uncharacterized membrane protein YbaN (DUF454 family)
LIVNGVLRLHGGAGRLRKVIRIVWGVLLVLVGIVGLVVPIMPGWLFIIPGLVILSDYFPPIRRLLNWAKSKFEGTGKKEPNI